MKQAICIIIIYVSICRITTVIVIIIYGLLMSLYIIIIICYVSCHASCVYYVQHSYTDYFTLQGGC